VPHTLPNIIRTRAGARFCCALPSQFDPSVLLKVPDTFREETCSDQIEEASRNDEEDLQTRSVAALVNEVSDESACAETAKDGERKRCRWQTETNTCDESDR
jgi:hypothetical protein